MLNMNLYKDQRVSVLVDVQNMYYSGKNLYNCKVNFEELMKTALKGRKLVRALAYAIKADVKDEGTFHEALEKLGFEVKTKDLLVFFGGHKKGDWDVGIAIDAVRAVEKSDVLVVVSGDGDFKELYEYVRGKGCRIEVIAFGKTASSSIRDYVDDFIDMDKNKKYLIPLKPIRGGNNNNSNNSSNGNGSSNNGSSNNGSSNNGNSGSSNGNNNNGNSSNNNNNNNNAAKTGNSSHAYTKRSSSQHKSRGTGPAPIRGGSIQQKPTSSGPTPNIRDNNPPRPINSYSAPIRKVNNVFVKKDNHYDNKYRNNNNNNSFRNENIIKVDSNDEEEFSMAAINAQQPEAVVVAPKPITIKPKIIPQNKTKVVSPAKKETNKKNTTTVKPKKTTKEVKKPSKNK